ncbi:MAG TPA: hypothetical protein VGR53_00515 [Nitrososphaerales archaeon]|nr:hypothetical protein [Nitrososphaerales archaeon]
MKVTMRDIAIAMTRLAASKASRRVRTNEVAQLLGVDPRTVNHIVARHRKEDAVLENYGIVLFGKFIGVVSKEKRILALTPQVVSESHFDTIRASGQSD